MTKTLPPADAGRHRPLLVSDAMLLGYLHDRKNVTRRTRALAHKERPMNPECWTASLVGGDVWSLVNTAGTERVLRCPYGQPGDVLYLRAAVRYDEAGEPHFRATDDEETRAASKYTPSLLNRREHTPGVLRVKAVRIEALSALTDEDALLEGIVPVPGGFAVPGYATRPTPRAAFAYLWDFLNPTTPFSQPQLVWRVQTERTTTGLLF